MEPLKPMSADVITRTIETYAADGKPKAQLEQIRRMKSNERNEPEQLSSMRSIHTSDDH